jgi:hypothetical protein
MDEKTIDPDVVIESREGDSSVVYRRLSDGLRWRVTGVCDNRGLCTVGSAVVQHPYGGDVKIESVEQLNRLAEEWNRVGHIQSDEGLDVPTGPAYKGDCCPLVVEILDGE